MKNCHLFHEPVEITHALVTVASQENHDGPEYDLMMDAANYIRELENMIHRASLVLDCKNEEIKFAIPAMRKFAEKNPIHSYQGNTQDPCGVHAWLARNENDR